MRPAALKSVLWLIAAYHILMGAGAFLNEGTAAWLADTFFGIKLDLAPQTSYIVKLLGVYVLVFGILVLVTATDPTHYRVLLNLIVFLYACRVLNKIVFADLFTRAFAASAMRTWIDVALLALFGVSVFLLRPDASPSSPREGSGAPEAA